LFHRKFNRRISSFPGILSRDSENPIAILSFLSLARGDHFNIFLEGITLRSTGSLLSFGTCSTLPLPAPTFSFFFSFLSPGYPRSSLFARADIAPFSHFSIRFNT